MTDPNDLGEVGEGSARSSVPPPTKPGAGQVRGAQVFAGFALGAGISVVGWGLIAVGLQWLLPSGVGVVLGLLPPVGGIAGAMVWAARSGRKGIAIGLAIYVALAMLLSVACFALVLTSMR